MERIETESDWLACEEPSLLHRITHRSSTPDELRYRFLALNWAKKIAHLFQFEYELEWFQAFEKWVAEGNLNLRIECDTEIFIPLVNWSYDSPERSLLYFFVEISNRHICRAAVYAGDAASLNFPFPRAEYDRLEVIFRGKSQRKREAREAEENRIRTQWRKDHQTHHKTIGREFCDEFRCVAGNPFRPVTFDPAWRTSPVLDLAQTIDREQKYDLLPILADVLEESGCHQTDILHHCRGTQRHVKGCWVIDLATGVIDSLHVKQ
jgi:hypothetical protein